MEPWQYSALKIYLQHRQYPLHFNNQQRKNLEKQSKFFQTKNGGLYKKNKRQRNNLLKVVPEEEVGPILALTHDHPLGGHFGKDIMFNKIRDYYYWPQMYHDIREYVKSCEKCQRHGSRKMKEPLHLISVQALFHRVRIDIVGPLPILPRSNRYIVVATDYMTKWPEARAISRANAQEVAKFIYEDIICRHGCPSILLSDQGSHFNNRIIDELLAAVSTKHHCPPPIIHKPTGLW